MSRSYKHSPQCGNSKKYGRYLAKKRNRQYNKSSKNPNLNHSLYKKIIRNGKFKILILIVNLMSIIKEKLIFGIGKNYVV